jgi:putative peptide zinc metalloprotease protein
MDDEAIGLVGDSLVTQPFPALRTDLRFTPHRQHERVWYAVEDPLNGRFLRLGRDEYLAASLFDGKRDAAAIITEATAIDGEFSLAEAELASLSSWLMRANCIAGTESARLFSDTSTPLSSKWVWDPFSARFPFIKGAYVERAARAFQFLAHPRSVVLAAILMTLALVKLVSNWHEFYSYTGNLFVAEGQFWWLIAWLLLKFVHEMGHAVTAVKAGSQIRSAGISFIFLAPVPFIDVSDLWSISNRWQRILCSCGGILFEMLVAAAAVLLAFTAENDTIRYFACAIAVTGTFTTLAFNANPLVRFDGYFILADLLQRPNLWGDGQLAVRDVINRITHPLSATSTKINWILAVYGASCTIYRYGMLVGLGFTALIVWQEYGVLLIAWGVCAWFILPWLKSRKVARSAALVASNPAAGTMRLQAWNLMMVVAVVCAVFFLPAPMQPSVPGIVTLSEPTVLRTTTEGYLSEVFVDEHDRVEPGDLLARFENTALLHRLESKRIEVACSTEQISAMRARGQQAEFQAEQAKLQSLQEQLGQLEKRVQELEVRAPVAGTIMSSDLRRQLGKFFTAGAGLTWIAKPGEFEIKLSATQLAQAEFHRCVGQPVYVTSTSGRSFVGVVNKPEWRGSDVLDEPALAATYGGPITVETSPSSKSSDGIKLPAPRFDIRLGVDPATASGLVAGELAWARVPNSSARLVDLLCHWVNKRWEAAKLLNKKS